MKMRKGSMTLFAWLIILSLVFTSCTQAGEVPVTGGTPTQMVGQPTTAETSAAPAVTTPEATMAATTAATEAMTPAGTEAMTPAATTAATMAATTAATMAATEAATPAVTQTQAAGAVPGSEATGQLEIYHWWTAPGEREAADAMFAAFNDKYPNIEVMENPNPGGGGVNQRVVLQSRIASGDFPDTFQTLGGAELKNYVDSGVLQPLDDLWQELNYAEVIPGPLAKAVTIDGHPYVVPLNMHIQNILYYNKKLFDENNLQPPTTFDELMAVCNTLKTAQPNMSCLGLGSKEKWGDAFVFDSILLEEIGAENYVKLYRGEVDVSADPAYRTSLEKFQQLIPFINTDHSGLTWDQAVGLVGSGRAAMTIMGTWAICAFTKGSNWQPDVDFGAVTFPQEPDRILLFHPDAYGLAVNAPNPEATENWLRVVASPELQIPTDVTQGGLFERTDIDATEFPDPIRQELQSYVSENPDMLILDQHGSIMPAAAQTAYWDILSAFLAQPNVDSTIQNVASMFTTYSVKEESAWYTWP
ncbi:MAG: extracellular solute-binding protein [Chloroflexi bacterium]|nr:MAG: extracellular solute-binding protein [Chloroflexota bacterium]